jgi:hypothetical protein
MRRPEQADLSTNFEPDECGLAVGAVAIRVSDHAVVRYRERVRPGLEHGQACSDLERLLEHGYISSRAPVWLRATQGQRSAYYYLVVGDIALPLDPCARDRECLVALTCLIRGGLSDAARASRNLKRRRRPSRHPTPPV